MRGDPPRAHSDADSDQQPRHGADPPPAAAPGLSRGRYRARTAHTALDMAAIMALRGLAFHGDARTGDDDAFDAACAHVLIEDAATGQTLGAFRMLSLASAAEIGRSCAAQHYDLTALARYPGPAVELGRFCVHPDRPYPDILRVAWGALTAWGEARGIALLFGCASFAGTDPAPYADTFAMLHARHAPPPAWRPGPRAAERIAFAERSAHRPDPQRARRATPPLLRTYLGMGAWVSDHAVIDRAMNTLHVFTALEVAAIPAARRRLLRALTL